MSEYGNIRFDNIFFSILQYWHQVKGVFPILASMAYDIFVIPVSTVASETYFSAANMILTDKRTRLGENVFETMILLKNWYDVENRLQDKSWMHSLDREEATVATSSNLGEGMPEPEVNHNQSREEEDSFARYSNSYMYNYEEYGYMCHHLPSESF
jgi:hAT family C-terminal dimerisation region